MRPGSNDGLAWDWWIDIGVQYWQIVGILIKVCQLIDVLTMDWQRIGIGMMCGCRIGKLSDWSWIDIGLGMNWLSIANQLEMDLFWFGTGLSMNWRRPGCGDLAPDWDGLALDRHRTGDGLTSDR